MKQQVEDRLTFLADGTKTRKNLDVMEEVLTELKSENLYVDVQDGGKKKKKKKKSKKAIEPEAENEPEPVVAEKPKKKKKKAVEDDE